MFSSTILAQLKRRKEGRKGGTKEKEKRGENRTGEGRAGEGKWMAYSFSQFLLWN